MQWHHKAMYLTPNCYALPGPDYMASFILKLLAENRLAEAVPLAITAANNALNVNFFESNALAALVLGKAGQHGQALEYWDKIIRSSPQKLAWLEGGLLAAFGVEAQLPEAAHFIKRWQKLLENVYISVPSFSILKNLTGRGWNGSGSVGIYDGHLKGWFWLPVAEKPKIKGEFAQKADFQPMLTPIAKDAQFGLYSINMPLPEGRGLFRFQVTDAAGRHLKGSPLCGSPASYCQTARAKKDSVPTILIPVYGDVKATLACLGSVFASLKFNRTRARILVLWDCGPEQALLKALRKLAQRGKIELQENPWNMGFLASVNNGMAKIATGDIIWLNADTIVHGNWLDRLICAGARADAATVTVLGNEAELMSYPSYFDRGKITSLRETAILDQAASSLDPEAALLEIPVGVGFCMLVCRRAIAAIGGLDGFRLFRGYGEETDYCLRAKAVGLKNYGAFNVFVGHLGERSFGEGKIALASQNNDAIFKHFPNYRKEYDLFLRFEKPKKLRQAIAANVLRQLGPLGVLEIRPWSARYVPPWLKDKHCQPEGRRTALFLRPGHKARAILRHWSNIALPDIFFSLAEERDSLQELLEQCLFDGATFYPAARAVVDLARELVNLPEVKLAEAAPLPLFELDPGGRTVLAAAPASMRTWKNLLALARDCPTDRFFVFFVDSLWPGALKPANVLEMPMMEDYLPLGPDCLLLLDNQQDAPGWQAWLACHNAPDLPICTWSES